MFIKNYQHNCRHFDLQQAAARSKQVRMGSDATLSLLFVDVLDDFTQTALHEHSHASDEASAVSC